MLPASRPDFRWFFRTVRVLPVVGIAALVGGMIGGFSVFAIDLALSPSPSHEVRAEASKINEPKANGRAPMRTFDASGFTPVAGTSAPPTPAQANSTAQPSPAASTETASQGAPQIAVTPPLPTQQKVWPDALSRQHQVVPSQAQSEAAKPQVAPGNPPAAPTQAAADHAIAPQPDSPDHDAQKPVPAKRRVAIKRKAQPARNESAAETSSRDGRPVYDYYDRDDTRTASDEDGNADANYKTMKRGYVRRGQRPEVRGSEDRSDDRWAERSDDGDDASPEQAAPPPPFFGLFGFGDR